jgi:hypothetical protein
MGSNFTDLKSIEVVCLSLLIELSAVSLLTDTRFHLICKNADFPQSTQQS